MRNVQGRLVWAMPPHFCLWDAWGSSWAKIHPPIFFTFPTYMTTCVHIHQLNQCHRSPVLSDRARWSIIFTSLHTLSWLFLPPSHARKHTSTRGDRAIKFSDEWLKPLAGVVCALWLLTDVEAAFRKHCWQRASQSSIRQITESDPVSQPFTLELNNFTVELLDYCPLFMPYRVKCSLIISFVHLLLTRVLVSFFCPPFGSVFIRLLAEQWWQRVGSDQHFKWDPTTQRFWENRQANSKTTGPCRTLWAV